ncbi:MAG: sterol desaturase family protein [Gammaproteobacteria bacterium]|nr:sterol desaturase family protein [Gammaproteobacteria bacterium]
MSDATQPIAVTTEAGLFNDDGLALLLVVTLALLWWVEMRRPFLRPGLRTLKNSYLTNLETFLFNDITLSLLSIPTLMFVAQQLSGYGLLSQMPEGPLKYGLTFVLLDLALYGWHYLTHHVDALWVFHRVHHSDRVFNVTTGLRFHFGELFLEVLVRVAFIGLIGVSAPVVLVGQTVISIFVLFHHTNIRFQGEEFLSRLFIVPRLHRLHHSVIRTEHDSNYGAVFSLWDRLFGTLQDKEPAAIGLAGVDEQRFIDLLRYGLPDVLQSGGCRALARSLRQTVRSGAYLQAQPSWPSTSQPAESKANASG